MPKSPLKNTISFAFFGSSRFSVIVLDELEKNGLIPSLIITTPDKPQGRKLILTPTPVKEWAAAHKVAVMDPEKLDEDFIKVLKRACEKTSANDEIGVFVVASYGKIIPKTVIDISMLSTLNIHPSLLPQYRGASPLQAAILDDMKNTGVTVMNIDEKMDQGPIVAQENVHIDEWPIYEDFEEIMAKKGALLLAQILPDWIAGKIKAKEQDHTIATYTKKITKLAGALNLANDPYMNFRKIQAYHDWPGTYFFITKNGRQIRIKITKASYKKSLTDKTGTLVIEKVIPEGGKEISFEDFERGYGKLTPLTEK